MSIPDEIFQSLDGQMAAFRMLLAGMEAGGRIEASASTQIEEFVEDMLEARQKEIDRRDTMLARLHDYRPQIILDCVEGPHYATGDYVELAYWRQYVAALEEQEDGRE